MSWPNAALAIAIIVTLGLCFCAIVWGAIRTGQTNRAHEEQDKARKFSVAEFDRRLAANREEEDRQDRRRRDAAKVHN